MSASAVLADLQAIQAAGFHHIRTYSVDCATLSIVCDQAISLGMSLTVGVYLDDTGTVRGQADLSTVIAWAQWSNVVAINIGNEAVFNGWISATAMVAFIGSATTQLRNAGYTGIVSTVETVGTYQANPILCDAVETIIHANIHAYFDAQCTSAEAGSFVVSQQQLVAGLCGKQVIISESGWPSGGGNNGAAIASPQDQQTAINSIRQATGGACTFFSYKNDPWKPPGVEQYFGTQPPFFYVADFVGCCQLF